MGLQLKKYDSSCQGSRTAAATISFGGNGLVSLSALAMEQMRLKPGDKVSLFQDEKEQTDWYVGKDKDGLPLRDNKGAGAFNASSISSSFRESLDLLGGGRFVFSSVRQKPHTKKQNCFLS